MTVSNTESDVFYVGGNIFGPYPFNVTIFKDEEVIIKKRPTTGTTETLLEQITDYIITDRITGIASGGPYLNGINVTFTALTDPTYTYAFLRDIEILQQVEYKENTPFPAKTNEQVVDRLTLICQQLKRVADKALRFLDTADTQATVFMPPPDPGKALVWNTSNNLKNSTDNIDDILAAVNDAEAATAADAASAAASSSSASTSAANADVSESNADVSEANAAASAAAALVSEINALASADEAAIQAGIATGAASGLFSKGSVRLATTGNHASTYDNGTAGVGATLTGTSNGAISVDGTTPSVNDRILFKNQTTTFQNGIYTITQVGSGGTPFIATRATDYDTSAEIVPSSFCTVAEGSTNIGRLYLQTTNGTITVGTTAIVFVQYNLTVGTVTNVSTGGLATGGPITGSGTITVTAATVGNVITGTGTTQAVTPDALAGIWEKGSDIASASTITIPSSGGGFFHVTGTTTINGITESTTKTGRTVYLVFEGILQLTHNATSFSLPSLANITTASGDVGVFVQEGSNNWRCILFQRRDGTPLVETAGSSPFSQEFIGGAVTYTADNANYGPWPHGLGTHPKIVSIHLRCIVADLEYSIGDVLYLTAPVCTNPATESGFSVLIDSTNITIKLCDRLRIVQKTSLGSPTFVTLSRWEFLPKAWV